MTAEAPAPKSSPLANVLAAHKELKKLVPLAQRLTSFQAAAERYLEDAQRIENSEHTRADCACDACYMFARVALRGADEHLEHPNELVFWGAAEQLGWPAEALAPAVGHLFGRYAPPREGEREGWGYAGLMALAQRLREATAQAAGR